MRANRGTEVALGSDALELLLRETSPAIDEAERLFIEASPIGRAVLEQVTVRRPELERLCELATKEGGEPARLAERLGAKSLGELTAPFSDQVSRWAESQNKRARLEIVEPQLLLPKYLADVLGAVLTHLLRNAIAHGIELPDERERKQSPVVGVVRVGASAADGSDMAARLYIEDDGAGVAENPLLAAAAQRARPLSNDDTPSGSFRAAEERFEDELSGRGMGLSAVVRELEVVGLALSVSQRTTGGTRFEIGPAEGRALGTGT